MARGYFRPEAIRLLIDEHVSGRANWHHQLWNLLMLELWHQMFIDGALSPPERSIPSAAEAIAGAAAHG